MAGLPITELVARYGDVSDAARAQQLLDDRWAAIERLTGQTFESGEQTERLRVLDHQIRLPHRPVLAVASVALVNPFEPFGTTTITGWSWDGFDRISVIGWGAQINLPEEWVDWPPTAADVAYTFGWDPLPADLVGVACASTWRRINAPAPDGLIGETIGGYSYQRGGSPDGGAAFTDDEERILRAWKPAGTSVSLR